MSNDAGWGDDAAWLLATVIVVGSVVFGLVAHEYMWINHADDYTKCLGSCSYTLDGHITLEELKCAEICRPLSACNIDGDRI